MEKKSVIIGILILAVVALVIFVAIGYNKNVNLTSRNNQLEADRAQLSSDKEKVINEREQCQTEVQNLNSKLSMLQEDVSKIYKTCITQNVCKGHYPGVRWNCNNVGDETNVNPSHICVCDSSCSLNATEIKKS
jgi:outer membrane murein-binding lipoprotein Lpp